MALTLRRWVGLLGVCCAAVFAAFEKTWTGVQEDSLEAEGRRIVRQLEEEFAFVQASRVGIDLGERSRAARSQGLATFILDRAPEHDTALPFHLGCEVRHVDVESGVFQGFLSPESCLSPRRGQARAEVFEFEVKRDSWVQVVLTARAGGRDALRVDLLDEYDELVVTRASYFRATRQLSISEWLDAGTYRAVVSRSYFGGGPFDIGFDVVDRSGLKTIEPETQAGGGGAARVEPWGRIPPLESPVYWVDGVGSAYQAGEWETLPRVLRSRDGEAIVASMLSDSVVVTPIASTGAGTIALGEAVSGQLEDVRAPTVWKFAIRDSTHLAVRIQAASRVSVQVYDSRWNLKAFGQQSLTAAVAPGSYYMVLGPVPGVTAYNLWLGRCGDYFEAALGRPVLPVGEVDEGCAGTHDVVTFQLPTDRVLSLAWSDDGEPAVSTVYDPEGAAWRMTDRTGVPAGRYNLVTLTRPSATLTIVDHGPAESFLASRLRAAVDSLRLNPSTATVGVLAVGDMHFPREVPPGFGWVGQYRFLGESAEDPYCALVTTRATLVYDFGDWSSDHLGSCWTYARFGGPGSSVARWLQEGGILLAESREPSQPARSVVEEGPSRPRGLFGRFPTGTYQAVPEACRVGYLEVCEAAFLHVADQSPEYLARAVRDTPLVDSPTRSRDFYYGLGESVMADLVADFGDERFAAFWTSDREVQEAFSAAFGIGVAEWMHAWTVSRLGAMPPPRDLRWLDVLLLLMFVAGIAWLSCAMHSRVEIGGQRLNEIVILWS